MSKVAEKIGKTINESMQDGGSINEAMKATGKLNADTPEIKEKHRLSLADFYYKDKHATGLQMPILLPSGEDSGETLNIIGPDCDSAVQSGRAYTRAIFALDESLQELEVSCKESGNFFEYNTQRSDAVSELNIEFAINIVTGWSFENEFTKESFSELLHQFPGLAQQISDFHTNSREKLYAK